MGYDSEDMFSSTLASDAQTLRRALRRVKADADEALRRMDLGQRPATTIAHSSPIDIRDVEKYAARVDMLLNWAGSKYLPEAAAIEALKQQ